MNLHRSYHKKGCVPIKYRISLCLEENSLKYFCIPFFLRIDEYLKFITLQEGDWDSSRDLLVYRGRDIVERETKSSVKREIIPYVGKCLIFTPKKLYSFRIVYIRVYKLEFRIHKWTIKCLIKYKILFVKRRKITFI